VCGIQIATFKVNSCLNLFLCNGEDGVKAQTLKTGAEYLAVDWLWVVE
jgi:hypothetical protein